MKIAKILIFFAALVCALSLSACKLGDTDGDEFDEYQPHIHSFSVYYSDNNATCTKDGTKTARCTCGAKDTVADIGSAYGHVFYYYYESNNDATCLKDGTKTSRCERCGKTDTKPDLGSALGHDFCFYESNNDATCLKDGTKTSWCERCDETDTKPDIGSALGHDKVPHEAKLSTCTEKGYKAYETCTRCDYNTYEETQALGHSYTKNGNDKNDHWTECIRCFDKIDIAQHSFDENSICACGYGCEHIEETPTTCEIQAKCSKCENFYGELAEHTPEEIPAKAPSCTESGLTAGSKCSVCDEILLAQTIVSELGHSFAEYVSDNNATCTEDGTKTAVCSRSDCNITHTVTDEGTKRGHSFTNYISDNNASWGIDETKTAKCDRCDETDTITDIGSSWLKFTLSSDKTYYSITGINIEISENISIPSEYNGLPVKSIGNSTFSGCSGLESVTFGENSQLESIGNYAFRGCTGLKTITFGENSQLESIGDDAFEDCTGLTSITIPDSVTSIGSYAFRGCTGLKTITFGENSQLESIGDDAFEDCTGLTSITIPDSVTSIGDDAFEDCTGLESIILPFVGATKDGTSNTYLGYIFGASDYSYNYAYVPTSLKTVVLTGGESIGDHAFSGCTGLESVTFGENSQLESIGNYAFSGCTGLTSITIPDSVTSIGNYAFKGCTGLKTIAFGENNKLESIGNWAFYNCTGLTNITIPDGVTSIGFIAFEGCTGLTSITIPDSVTSIGNYAFSGCTGLTSVTFGENSKLESIGSAAFEDCTGLESIILPFVGATKDGTSKTHFGYIFGASTYNYNDDYVPTSLKTVIITGGESIGFEAFKGCTGLTSITIPDSVTSIGEWAFSGCTNLKYNEYDNAYYLGNENNPYLVLIEAKNTSITSCRINSNTKFIHSNAFQDCKGLTSITIPDSVTSIGRYAFRSCTGLESIILPFVGATKDGTSKTHFGYIFGASDHHYADDYYVPASLKTVVITGGESISDSAFYQCTGLTSITIPNSVTSIGSAAFYQCTGLTSITIPDSVTNIGYEAFYGCYKLVEVYNESSLNITKGSEENGYVAYYALNVYTPTSGESKLNTVGDYIFYVDGETIYLLGYTGNKTEITLPESYNGKNYVIYKYAFIYRDDITSVIIPGSVTSIGFESFYKCTGLTNVTIGNGVTSIDTAAFSGCTGLTSVTFGENSQLESIGRDAFYGCYGLTSITIPESVTSIGRYAFEGCTGLTSIIIPDSVTSIGSSVFMGCSKLESITLPFIGDSRKSENDTYQYPFGYIFGTYSYTGGVATEQYYYGSSTSSITSSTYYIPSSLKSVTITGGNILYGAFYNCSNIKSITIGDGVTSISYSAFEDCTGLESVTFGENSQLESIGSRAFYYCTGLESVTIPDSVTSIDEWAFYYCTGLTSITIGNGVTSIGSSAFYNCYKLVEVYNKSSLNITKDSSSNGDVAYYALNVYTPTSGESKLHTVDDYIFYVDGETIYLLGYTGDETELTLPESYNGKNYAIYNSAFIYRDDITSVIIPDSVLSLGGCAFQYCDGLTSVTIGNGVTSIGGSAFSNCTGLKSITIPDSVTSIGGSAFNSSGDIQENHKKTENSLQMIF